MKLFRKTKPQNLTLREIHNLYLLLKHCLPEREQTYLIDEIEKMVSMMEGGEVLTQALAILYPNQKINQNNPLELLLLFIRGLKQNSFFEYVSFVKRVRRA